MNELLDQPRESNQIINKLLNNRNITGRLETLIRHKNLLAQNKVDDVPEEVLIGAMDDLRTRVRKELNLNELDLFEDILTRLLTLDRARIALYHDQGGKDAYDEKHTPIDDEVSDDDRLD